MKSFKKLCSIAALLMLLQVPVALQASESDAFTLCSNIPFINAPLKMVKYEGTSSQRITEVAGTALLHGLVAWCIPAETVQERLAHHLVLALAANSIGLVGTVAHELGHAVMAKWYGRDVDHIGVRYDYTTPLYGAYSGYIRIFQKGPRLNNASQVAQDVYQVSKDDALTYMKQLKEFHKGTIYYLLAGPLVGAVTNAGLFIAARTLYPSFAQSSLLTGAALFALMYQNGISLNPYIEGVDAQRAAQAYGYLKATEVSEAKIVQSDDNTLVTIDLS